ncbi:MAG: hypothetical protein ACLRZ9_00250 [Eubacterium sp.]
MQDDEGKWGIFHSMSQPTSLKNISTEFALRRLERLGFTMEDECIQKAVSYMNDCLTGKKSTPDYREQKHDWDNFMALLLSTWIRRFTSDNSAANKVAKKWAHVITSAFKSGTYDYDDYTAAYDKNFGIQKDKCIIGMEIFYPISIISGCLDEKTEQALVDYIMDCGIYYIYDKKLSVLPECFESKEASRYLAAIEMLAQYKQTRHKFILAMRFAGEHFDEFLAEQEPSKAINKKFSEILCVVVKQNCYTWDRLIPACVLLETESALRCMNAVSHGCTTKIHNHLPLHLMYLLICIFSCWIILYIAFPGVAILIYHYRGRS